MDNRPIGVFDSGLGGLTSVRRFNEIMPGEDIIYLGDTGRVPYGSRSKDTIISYSKQDVAFLCSFDIKAIVIACNTASAAALDTLKQCVDKPFFGVIEATVSKAIASTQNGKIGVIGTAATIGSGAYERLLKTAEPSCSVMEKACPLFVPLVENGRISHDDIVVQTIVAEYLDVFKQSGVDTVILGCTHYPLLAEAISDFMGGGVRLIDSGAATAEIVYETFKDSGMLSNKTDGGSRKYYVTDSTDGFSQTASLFLGSDIGGKVEKISLERF